MRSRGELLQILLSAYETLTEGASDDELRRDNLAAAVDAAADLPEKLQAVVELLSAFMTWQQKQIAFHDTYLKVLSELADLVDYEAGPPDLSIVRQSP